MLRRVLVVASLAFCACNRGSELPASDSGGQDAGFPVTDSRPRLISTPDDLTSDVGAAPLIFNVERYISAADLQAVAAAVSLRTYPELQPVLATTTFHLAETPSTGPVLKDAAWQQVDSNSYVTVLPSSALDPAQWYVMTVDTLPTTVMPPGFGPIAKEGPRYGARFRLGSAPVVREIDALQDGRVVVGFSEGVTVDETTVATMLKVMNPDSSACSYLPNESTTPPPNFGGVFYQCDKTVLSSKSLFVSLTPGLAAPSKAPLSWIDGSASTSATLASTSGQFLVTSFPLGCGGGCIEWRP